MKPGFEMSAHKIFGYLRNQIPTAMAVSIPKTTPEQKAIGKKVRQNLYGKIQSKKRHGGITFVGPKGVGKTRMVGEVHSKAPKDEKTLNLFATCKTDHAEKQATEVRVTVGCKPLMLSGCVLCGGDEDEGDILLCEICDQLVHALCVGFKGRIEGVWVCAPCVLQEEEEEEGEEQDGDAAAAA